MGGWLLRGFAQCARPDGDYSAVARKSAHAFGEDHSGISLGIADVFVVAFATGECLLDARRGGSIAYESMDTMDRRRKLVDRIIRVLTEPLYRRDRLEMAAIDRLLSPIEPTPSRRRRGSAKSEPQSKAKRR